MSESLNQSGPPSAASSGASSTFRLHSLRHRLPVLIFALLAAVGATFAWMAYREVERALRISGLERAAGAATQISNLLSQSIAARVAETSRVAASPEVREIVRSGKVPSEAAVPTVLGVFLSRNQQTKVSLYSATGAHIVTMTRGVDGQTVLAPASAYGPTGPSEDVSPLRLRDGRVGYAVTAAIAAEKAESTPDGYLSVWRPLGSAAAAGLIERLIGSEAVIRLGNVSGDLWTDLNSAVAAPSQPLSGSSARYARDGEMRLAASASISGTPWVAWADLSEASMLAPARVLVKRMMPITLLITALGALAAYVLSAGVTRPLQQVAEAAQAIAAGDYSRRVGVARRDEIGYVGTAFNVMAARVGESHDALEARVRARTQELEAFSYSVSHDLRAPLRHISGFAALLQKSGSSYLTHQDRRYVETIVEAAGRMSRLVDDLLGFSRMARADVHQTIVDCDELVREVVTEQAPEAAARRIDWVLSPLPRLRGDRAMLKVVFTNLVANAVKYTSRRDAARIEIGAMPATNGERVLFVRDNGVGFDMQYSDKLFGVFQRLHSVEEFEGTGIGLASVQRIVHRHGGRTWAESAVDSGATFYVALPGDQVVAA